MLVAPVINALRTKGAISIEFVCLGNICRSPMAAAILDGKSRTIKKPKILVTSSGTGAWHVGESANYLSQETWEKYGYLYDHTAQKFNPSSFNEVDLILAMDNSNRKNILSLCKSMEDMNKVLLLKQFDPRLSHIDPNGEEVNKLEVPDPWGLDSAAFEKVFWGIESAIDGLIQTITTSD